MEKGAWNSESSVGPEPTSEAGNYTDGRRARGVSAAGAGDTGYEGELVHSPPGPPGGVCSRTQGVCSIVVTVRGLAGAWECRVPARQGPSSAVKV